MNVSELQQAVGAVADGKWGRQSWAALIGRFSNQRAPAVTVGQLQHFADRLGCSLRQLAAVAAVESSGGAFERDGRPKILFERHWFHRLTDGRYEPAAFSNPVAGGYDQPSWVKLSAACACDPDAAFSSTSWGKFQVMGGHWSKLGYASPFALALSTVESEAAHYELLARYIEVFGLKASLARLTTNPGTCRDFAAAYNGRNYAAGGYHAKLAEAMA